MLAHQRIVLLQLEAGRIVATVLKRHIHMTALGAAKLNQDAVTLAFLRHLEHLLHVWANGKEPLMGFEPMTFPLPRECSAPELQRLAATLAKDVEVGRAGLEPAKRCTQLIYSQPPLPLGTPTRNF